MRRYTTYETPGPWRAGQDRAPGWTTLTYSNVGIRHVAGSGPRVLFDYDGLMRATPGAAFSLHLLTAKATGTWDTYTSAEYLTW